MRSCAGTETGRQDFWTRDEGMCSVLGVMCGICVRVVEGEREHLVGGMVRRSIEGRL